MKLTFCDGLFPFIIPEKDAGFASSVGPQTYYPAGFSLDHVAQFYWRAQNYTLAATGHGVYGSLTQDFAISGAIPPRNVQVGNDASGSPSTLPLGGPAYLATGVGVDQTVPNTGTLVADGPGAHGTNAAPLWNLVVNLFWPVGTAADPVIKYAGLWWPLMTVTCNALNNVTLDEGGELGMTYVCGTGPDSTLTVEIGTMSFFGMSVPVRSRPLGHATGPTAAETRAFTGALTVASEWP